MDEKIMQFNAFTFIFLTPGVSPATNSITTEKNGYRFKATGIDIDNKDETSN